MYALPGYRGKRPGVAHLERVIGWDGHDKSKCCNAEQNPRASWLLHSPVIPWSRLRAIARCARTSLRHRTGGKTRTRRGVDFRRVEQRRRPKRYTDAQNPPNEGSERARRSPDPGRIEGENVEGRRGEQTDVGPRAWLGGDGRLKYRGVTAIAAETAQLRASIVRIVFVTAHVAATRIRRSRSFGTGDVRLRRAVGMPFRGRDSVRGNGDAQKQD